MTISDAKLYTFFDETFHIDNVLTSNDRNKLVLYEYNDDSYIEINCSFTKILGIIFLFSCEIISISFPVSMREGQIDYVIITTEHGCCTIMIECKKAGGCDNIIKRLYNYDTSDLYDIYRDII